MLVAAVVIVPVGVTAGRGALLRPGILATGLAIGLLSSIIPYTLELEALRRVPARVFGIWMSLEPAVAALVGLVMLGEALAVSEWAAIVCVMVACAGAARGSAPVIPGPGGVKPPAGMQTGRAAPTMGTCQPTPPRRRVTRRRPLRLWAASRPAGARPSVARRWAAAVWDPTPVSMRRIALAGVISSAVIIMTGAAVRLSKSGLGCPDWPQCTRSSLVAAPTRGDPMFHTWIEFGNRMVTVVVTVVAVAVLIAAWRFRPGGPGAGAGPTWSGWPPRSRPGWWRRSCSAGSWC